MRAEPTPRIKPSKRPRYRYILFELPSPAPQRNEVIRNLQEAARPELGLWLTRYEAGRGIVRVLRGQEKAARALLEGTRLNARPISTSGTIAALNRGHGDRRKRQRDAA